MNSKPRSTPQRITRIVIRLGILVLVAVAGIVSWNLFGPKPAPQAVFSKTVQELSEGKLEQAWSGVELLFRLRTPTVDDWLLKAEIARRTGRDETAIAALTNIPKGHRSWPASMLSIGLLRLGRAEVTEARTAFSTVVESESVPEEILAKALRELLRIDLYTNQRTAVDHWLRKLSRLDLTGLTFDEAFLWTVGRPRDVGPAEMVETLQKWLATDPENPSLVTGMAEALRSLGRLDEASEVLARSTSKDSPEWAAVALKIALDQGDLERARTILSTRKQRAASPAHPDSEAELSTLEGRIALSSGDPQPAVRAFQMALKYQPGSREAQFGLAQALRLLGRADEARGLLRQVKERDDLEQRVRQAQVPAERESPASLAAIAELCERSNRPEMARAWYRLALVRDPSNTLWQSAVNRLKVLSRD